VWKDNFIKHSSNKTEKKKETRKKREENMKRDVRHTWDPVVVVCGRMRKASFHAYCFCRLQNL
jgi:hypothetical protein